MKSKPLLTRLNKIFNLPAILFLALVLRLANLNQSFWLDEAAQAIESARPLREQLNIISDFHPPLYHLILHFWMIFGKSEIWLRLPSVIFGVLSIFFLYRIAEIIFDKKTAVLAALFLAISPFHLWYSQEARPYMLFVLLSLVSTYFLLIEKWMIYTLEIILLLYSLYFAPFLLFGHFIYVLIFRRKSLMRLIKSFIIASFTFLPWLPYFINQIHLGTGGGFAGWTSVVSVPWLKLLPLTLAKFALGHGTVADKVLYGFIIFPEIIVFLISVYCLSQKETGRILLTLFSFSFLPALVISIFIPVAAPQRLIYLLPFFLLIIAEGVLSLPKFSMAIFFLIVLSTSFGGIYQYYTDPYTQREEWRQAVSYAEKNATKDSVALFVFPTPFAPFLWYQKGNVEGVGIAPKFIIRDSDIAKMNNQITGKNRIFLFQYLTGLTDNENKTGKDLSKEGYSLTSTKDFPGVGFIYVYDKK